MSLARTKVLLVKFSSILISIILFSMNAFSADKTNQGDPAKAQRFKFGCGFENYNNWQQFLKFEDKPIPYFEYKSGTKKSDYSELISAELFKVGKVTAGSCKDAEILIGTVVDPECPNKTSPEPIRLFGADFNSDEQKHDQMLAAEINGQDDGNCYWSFRAIKVDDILFTDNEYAEKIEKFLKKKYPKIRVIRDKDITYHQFAFPENKEIESKETKIKLAVKNYQLSDYYLKLEKDIDFKKYKFFATDPTLGSIYINDRFGIRIFPDHTVSSVDLGLSVEQPSYWFLDFLPNVQKRMPFLEKDLSQITSSPGWFEIKNENNKVLKELYTQYKKRIKDIHKKIDSESGVYSLESKIDTLSYKEYLKLKPLLFYKDLLGRIQVFRKVIHEVPCLAEPLIYVYSNEPTKLNIKLCKNLQIKSTYPRYENFWKIETIPPSGIINLETGRKYNSLFWEGFAGQIPPFGKGWVVRSNEVSSLLGMVLPQYGLSKSEIEEFKSYWVPKLQIAPFYQIEILPQEWVDDICPLEITPKPDAFLRVHMRAYELNTYKEIPPPIIPKKFERKGLTIVEWSGILN